MSVVVRMEMPENCLKCPLHEFGGVCLLKVEHTAEEWLNIDKRRPLNCPIFCQLPEGHGDLIDASTFKKNMDYVCDAGGWLEPVTSAVTEYVKKHIDAQTVIVPADTERSET